MQRITKILLYKKNIQPTLDTSPNTTLRFSPPWFQESVRMCIRIQNKVKEREKEIWRQWEREGIFSQRPHFRRFRRLSLIQVVRWSRKRPCNHANLHFGAQASASSPILSELLDEINRSIATLRSDLSHEFAARSVRDNRRESSNLLQNRPKPTRIN